ncbi:MAG TPA: class I SAM-dependent methyltransferase [Steroidobacteraceae bacterium]|jgi:SAM-dependent methyltransferase|nr:class I SAM-dependent methyltransferase [Steroidobacteraceae bacterium]
MTTRAAAAAPGYRPAEYWEERARRFAVQGDGLAAVCSYGMPRFYNGLIQFCQRRALEPWLKVSPGTAVLDVGCGIGRWSRLLASRGASVTGIDLSPTMIAEAGRRATASGLADRCRFLVQDSAALEVAGPFDLILCVTVLQHMLDVGSLRSALRRMTHHLAPHGRLVVLEAAPARLASRCNTHVFTARERAFYLELFHECGLRIQALSGVDPAPFKMWLLPHLPRLPRALRVIALALVTALSAPLDALCGRLFTKRSWHAVFVLQHESGE